MSIRISIFGVAIFTAAFVGCGPSDGKFMLEGTVTWNGAPIERGDIEFQPADGKGQVEGEPIVNGKFQLRTNPGPKKISVIARRQIGLTQPTERIPTPEPIEFQYLPEKFNRLTELERTVAVGDKLTLELTGEELTPAGAVSPSDAARAAAQGGTVKE